MKSPAIAARIGASLLRTSRGFRKAISGTVGVGRDVASRTTEKLRDTQKKINSEDRKQEDIKKQVEDEIAKREKEGAIEVKKGNYKSGGFVDKIIKKPLESFWNVVKAWAILNLPTILKEVDIFVKKVKIFVKAINKTFKNVVRVFNSIVKIMNAIVKNIQNFDFADSSRRVAVAKEELDIASGDLERSSKETFNVWNRSEEELDILLAELESGETLNGALRIIEKEDTATGDSGGYGEQYTDAQPQTPMAGSGSGSSSTSASAWRPILELIARAESVNGSYDSIYPSSIKPGLSQMTIAEADAWQARTASQRGSAAAGRYQFMYIKDQAAIAGIGPNETFSPANQDKMAIGLIEKARKVNLDMVKNDPNQAAKRLSKEWAGLPVLEQTRGASRVVQRGQSYYYGDGRNKATVSPQQLTAAFAETQKPRQEPAAPQQTESSNVQPPKANTTSTVIDEFKGGASKSIPITSYYGMRTHPISGKSKKHAGIDIAPPGPGYFVSLKRHGKVARISNDPRGYGNFVIIETGDYSFMFAHLASVNVKLGEKYTGQPIGIIGTTGASTGIHLHYEVYRGGQGGPDINPRPFINLLSIGKRTTKKSRLRQMSDSMRVSSNTPAQKMDAASTIASRRTTGNRVKNNTTVIRQTEVIMPA